MKAIISNTNILAICGVVMLILVAKANVSEGAACNPNELSPCAGAISSGSGSPSSDCCSKLRAQEPCLCQYAKDPNFSKIVTSPSAQKVAQACGVPIPQC